MGDDRVSRPNGDDGVSGPRQILVVDDEPDMLENLTRILRRTPYRCVTAKSGAEALAAVARDRPALVVTDLRMPGMDGLALLRALRDLSPPVPVIIFTAYASETVAGEALASGAAAFLAKPFSAAQLLAAIERALGAPDGAPTPPDDAPAAPDGAPTPPAG